MADADAELKKWHDWTDPDFFAEARVRESRFMPLFLRQVLPNRMHRTKPTVAGWILVMVAVGVGWSAYNTGSNILFMTLSLLLSTLVLSGLLALINFYKLDWRLHAPAHLRAGEVGMAEVELENQKSVFPTMSLCFRVESEGPQELYMAHAVGGKQVMKLEWTFVPSQRGRCEVRLVGVESAYPFGFLRKTLGAELTETVLVWPGRTPYNFKPAPGGRRFLTGASRRTAGMGSDLLNVRPYQQGDAPRLVHWKATARLQKLMIRQLAQEGESGYHLRVDPDSALWTEAAFEKLCSVACSLADDLFHIARLESVTIAGQRPIMVKSIRDLHDFFDLLAVLERTPTDGLRRRESRSNQITFRATEAGEIEIFIDENKAGQTHD